MKTLLYNNSPIGYISDKPPIQLAVETTVDMDDLRLYPQSIEIDIRNELAIELAKKMLEEDLIIVEVDQSTADPLRPLVTARAKVKIIQE